jgi:hypothetical protein
MTRKQELCDSGIPCLIKRIFFVRKTALICIAAVILVVWHAHAEAFRTPVRASWSEDPMTTGTITWDTPEPARGTLRYGLTTNYTHTLHDGGGMHRHVFTLRDLKPGTRYYYQASSTDGYTSVPSSFMTAPSPDQPLHFAIHGDLEGGIVTNWAQSVAQALIDENPQWMLNMGDMAEEAYPKVEGFGQWTNFLLVASNMLSEFVFMPNMGNHDDPSHEGTAPDQARSRYHRIFTLPEPSLGNGFYAYTAGNSRFIALNSEATDLTEQSNWLTRELQAAANDTNITWIFSQFHRPPYSWGERGGWDPVKDAWCPIFAQYETDFVLSGHSHNYQRTVPIRGVTYMVVGGGGGRLYSTAVNEAHAYATTCYHYASFHVTGDVLQVRGVRSDGLVFDTATYTHQRHVRVSPAFPRRGESATVYYNATGGDLEGEPNVNIHIGQDDFTSAFADAPMTFNPETLLWEYTFTVPETATSRVVFVFHDQGNPTTNWHNNHDYNWQALLGRVKITPSTPQAGTPFTLQYRADMAELTNIPIRVWISYNGGTFAPTGFVEMAHQGASVWECSVTSPASATDMAISFYDGESWDDNDKRLWPFAITGATEQAWPPTPIVAEGSPVITDKPEGGARNHVGDNFDFTMEGPPVTAKDATKGFGDFGSLWINYDDTNLYIGGIQADLGGTNNVFILFLGLDTLSDNAWNLWHKTGLPNALDLLHNLRFTEPMDIAFVFGDQYGDRATYTNFTYGGCNFGQGIYYTGTNNATFDTVAGARLSQFDGTSTNPCETTADAPYQRTTRWESWIPWSSLGADNIYAVSNLFVAGIVASHSVVTNDRYLSRTYIGERAWGAKDANRQYARNTVHIRPLRVNLLHADLRGDGIPNTWRIEYFGSADGPEASEDSDQDGADNANEYISGTSPADPASVFRAATTQNVPAGQLTLAWPTATARLYDILFAETISSTFEPVASGITTGSYTTTLNGVTSGFYQIRVRKE